jgi:hypothetical protein
VRYSQISENNALHFYCRESTSSALKAAEIDAMLRSLRHDAERAKAAALADQRGRFEADLADATGRERSLREERDILIGQQQQQVEQIQVPATTSN